MGRSESDDDLRATSAPRSPGTAQRLHVLRGKESVLRMHGVLKEWSALCEQTGAMDHIALFLDSPMNENKTPYLILMTDKVEADPFGLGAKDLLGAAVVYEYAVFGVASGVFVTDDGSGGRTVVAPPAERSEITIRVCEHLMQRGSRAALLSYKESQNPETQDERIAAMVKQDRGVTWGSQVRDMSTYLTLRQSFNETLAQLGKHTRRNLRYYRRRCEAELGCRFYPDVGSAMSRQEFLELNRMSTHPVGGREMGNRFDDLGRIPDSFCVGMRARDGRWLSLMGGRRHHGWTEVDWQVNRGKMERFSLGTAMRAYFLENEVSLGTERLYFEGGTPHTMRHSLLTEKAVDIIAFRPSWQVRLMCRLARSRYGRKNFLLQTLASQTIRWQRF